METEARAAAVQPLRKMLPRSPKDQRDPDWKPEALTTGQILTGVTILAAFALLIGTLVFLGVHALFHHSP